MSMNTEASTIRELTTRAFHVGQKRALFQRARYLPLFLLAAGGTLLAVAFTAKESFGTGLVLVALLGILVSGLGLASGLSRPRMTRQKVEMQTHNEAVEARRRKRLQDRQRRRSMADVDQETKGGGE